MSSHWTRFLWPYHGGLYPAPLPHPDPRSCLLIPYSGFKPANQTKKFFDWNTFFFWTWWLTSHLCADSLTCQLQSLKLVSSSPRPNSPPLLFPVPGALNVGLYCNVYSPCPLWIYTCSRIVFLTPFNVDPFPGRPLNFNTGINSPWSVDPLPMKRALWAEYISSKAP